MAIPPWKPIETFNRSEMQFVLVLDEPQETVRLYLWNPKGFWEHANPTCSQVMPHETCAEPTHWMEIPEHK